jgi:hypothetical protein
MGGREWKCGIIYPVHEKGDVMMCDNYRAVTLLCTTYTVLENILYLKSLPFTEVLYPGLRWRLAGRRLRSRAVGYVERTGTRIVLTLRNYYSRIQFQLKMKKGGLL